MRSFWRLSLFVVLAGTITACGSGSSISPSGESDSATSNDTAGTVDTVAAVDTAEGCTALQKLCIGPDVFVCQTDGLTVDFVKTCGAGTLCADGECVCAPDCTGKVCGSDGCDGNCGTCEGGAQCTDDGQCGCAPQCDGVECGDDGCGGLCNNCAHFTFDDGSTETAFGYTEEPPFKPSKVACLVRFNLPFPNMRLTEFTAGWMYGLFQLAVPFDLVVVPGSAMACEAGSGGAWYLEYCQTTPDKVKSFGTFVPKEPYTPIPVEELGEIVLEEAVVYIGALFTIDQYPYYVCPVDDSGDGANSFMMPAYKEKSDGEEVLKAAAMKTVDTNPGSIPFSIKVGL